MEEGNRKGKKMSLEIIHDEMQKAVEERDWKTIEDILLKIKPGQKNIIYESRIGISVAVIDAKIIQNYFESQLGNRSEYYRIVSENPNDGNSIRVKVERVR